MTADKKYYVRLPIAGVLGVNVEAQNEEEAVEKALEVPWSVDITTHHGAELEELEAYRETGKGNVSYLTLDEAEAEEGDG